MFRTLALAAATLMLSGCFNKAHTYTLCALTSPNGQTINLNVEVRNDDAGRAEGLMYRKSLVEDEGMLFVWDDLQQRHMWMKNTLIPLDMLFLHDNRIIGMVENTVPLSETILTVDAPANRILEVAGGSLMKWGVGSQWHLNCEPAN